MYVIKRNGTKEEVKFDKIYNRLKSISLWPDLNLHTITINTINQMTDNITTEKLDILSAEICASMTSNDINYSYLGARLLINRHLKNLDIKYGIKTFSDIVEKINELIPDYLNKTYVNFVKTNSDLLNVIIDNDRNNRIDYFSYKTLDRAYLIKIQNPEFILETPQAMFLRVAITIHMPRDNNNCSEEVLLKIKETYDAMSNGYFIHATPTLFNAGTSNEQLSSCFLLGIDDSIDGIAKCWGDTAQISKWAGGIGIHISNIRSKNRLIKSTNGKSNGIVPMLKVFNDIGRFVNQCFVPDTVIYTQNGLKKIVDIEPIKDKVLTSDGTFRTVLQKIQNPKFGRQRIININTAFKNTVNLKCTACHEIMIIGKEHCEKILTQAQPANMDNLSVYHKFVPASNLKIGDKMVYAVPKHFIDYSNINYFECFVFGLTLVKKNVKLNPVLVNKLQSHFTDKLFIEADGTINLNLDIPTDKTIYMNLPRQKIMDVIEGICYNSRIIDENSYIYTGEIHVYDNILAEYIKYLCIRVGFIPSMTKNDDKYTIIIPHNYRSGPVVDYLYTAITNIDYEEHAGPFYDLNIQNNHNYTTFAGLVHNSGKRNGSIAIYIEPWHADIMEFLELKKTTGPDEERCRDLFLALWIPDRFMKAVENSEDWYLMSENECPGLSDKYGDEFDILYQHYIDNGKYVKKITASSIWQRILISQMESGVPYIAFKDNVNKKTNHKNLGTIKSSNLCCEIKQYSDDKEYAVCNLASIAVNRYFDEETGVYDYTKLYEMVKLVTYNLNRIIDINFYPVPETKYSNLKNRPIGIGIQGFADLLAMAKLSFEDPKSLEYSTNIMQTIYYSAWETSIELAKLHGPYESFEGSPLSNGIFQFDMWDAYKSDRYDWNRLKNDVIKYGARNSLITALMPTASTSQILGNTESFEPITSNIYTRRVLAGDFMIVNKHLVKDLKKLNLWNNEMREELIKNYGSVQNLNIPDNLKQVYKTVWEIKQKSLLNHAICRGPYVDQSQSMNLYFKKPTSIALTSALFYAWKNGLKTGSYYLRSQPAANAQQLSIEASKKEEQECLLCSA